MGLTQLSAQKGKNSTGSVVYDFYVGGVDGQGNPIVAIFPIFCDGIFVDAVSSTYFSLSLEYSGPQIEKRKFSQMIGIKWLIC
jgi:hypothetical protein